MSIHLKKTERYPNQEIKQGKEPESFESFFIAAKDIGDLCYLGPCTDGVREEYYQAESGCTDGPYYTTNGCDSSVAFADSVEIEWERGGASNVSYYQTKHQLPTGTTIKVKIARTERKGEVRLRERYNGPVSPAPFASILNPVTNQVIRHTLNKNTKFSVEVGGANFILDAISNTWIGGYYEMKIKDGWVLHIKISGDDF